MLLQNLMATPGGPRRLQVLDEAWALLGTERTSKYLQACWKLSRSYGVANLAIVHRLSDLGSQSDDGTSASKKMASTGHSGTQTPQSMQSSGLMTSMFRPARKASVGQTSTQSV